MKFTKYKPQSNLTSGNFQYQLQRVNTYIEIDLRKLCERFEKHISRQSNLLYIIRSFHYYIIYVYTYK